MPEATKNIPRIHSRDGKVGEKWDPRNLNQKTDKEYYSFDTEKREEAFIKSQFVTDDEWSRYTWYREEWYRRFNELDPGNAPLSVICELVSTCNLACPMCYTVTEAFQKAIVGSQRQMPWAAVKGIIDECADLAVPSMHFNWRGESTLYHDKDENGKTVRLPDVLSYARKRGILGIMVFTNGQLIDRKMAEEIVEADPSFICFSVDGLEEVYNNIRRPQKPPSPDFNPFERVMSAISYLLEARKTCAASRPQIRVTSIYPAIADDPRSFYEYMYNAGVDWVTVNTVSDYRNPDLPEEDACEEWSCQYPFQRLTISSNGIITPCTGAFKQDEGMVLGRFRGTPSRVLRRPDGSKASFHAEETTLLGAWNSGKMRNIRQAHAGRKGREIAPGCRDCRRSSKNCGVVKIPAGWDMNTMRWEEV